MGTLAIMPFLIVVSERLKIEGQHQSAATKVTARTPHVLLLPIGMAHSTFPG